MCHSSSHSQVHGISTDTVAAINTPLKSRKLASSRCNEFLTWFSLVLCANNQQVRQVRQQDSVNTSHTLAYIGVGQVKLCAAPHHRSSPSRYMTMTRSSLSTATVQNYASVDPADCEITPLKFYCLSCRASFL